MIRTKNKLTIYDDNNTVFSDVSNEAVEYGRDTFDITLDAVTSYLYVGFYKPINSFYFEATTANINAGTFTAEYYNGTAFTALTGFHDESKSFTRSGFVQWDRGQTDEAATTVNGTELFWYRLQPSVTHSLTTVSGLNIIFADDQDLKREYFEISDFLPLGETSFILTHMAVRDHIIQVIRNSGEKKKGTGDVSKDITPWDLLDGPSQIKLAATYLTLSKIFSNVQDDREDIWREKSKDYFSLYSQAQKTFYLDLDTNDDGLASNSERLGINEITVVRR